MQSPTIFTGDRKIHTVGNLGLAPPLHLLDGADAAISARQQVGRVEDLGEGVGDTGQGPGVYTTQ